MDGGGDLRVLLVDDHDLYRTGLRTVLEEHGMTVVAEAASGEHGLELAARLDPDVVVMDMRLPGIDGPEAIRRLLRLDEPPCVVVLTVSADESDVVEAIEAGATGYLLKEVELRELLDGIRAAARDRTLVSSGAAATLLARLRRESASVRDHGLTPRETAVLCLVAEGLDNGDIASKLGISPKTVKNHISNILVKLEAENRIQAAVWAVRAGIV